MASIFQRGKYWRVQIRRKGYPTITTTFDTKLEAQRWAAEKETEYAAQSPERIQKRIKDRQFTLKEAVDRYAKDVLPSKSANAQKNEQRFIRTYTTGTLADCPLAELDGERLTQTIHHWRTEREWGANYIRLHLAFLSFLFGVARKEWGMPELINPVPLVRKPRLPRGRDRRLHVGEEARLLAACAERHPELANIAELAIETAMRQGEILSLTWENVDLHEHTAYLSDTKNGDSRLVPLSDKAEACLMRQVDGSHPPKQGPVWTHYSLEGVRRAFHETTRKAGIVGLTFHDLRHEATSRLVERGMHIMTVQAITGHKSAHMLKRYTHISKETLVKAMRGVE